MTHAQSTRAPAPGSGNCWLTAFASLVVGTAFLALWFWLLPRWLGFRVEMAGPARWRWLAAVPSVLGFAVALRCIWDSGGQDTRHACAHRSAATIGRGGFLPLRAEPQYVGFAAGWIGL